MPSYQDPDTQYSRIALGIGEFFGFWILIVAIFALLI